MLIVPLFERQAAGVYRNSAAVIDADGSLLGVYRKMHIPDDPLFNEKYYFTPGRRARRRTTARRAAGERLPRLEDALRDDRRADLLGPVVSRGRAHHALLGADMLFYPTAIGWHPGGEGGVRRRRRWMRGAPIAARARDRQRRVRRVAEPRRPRGRAGHERHRVLRPLVHRRSVRPRARRGRRRSEAILIAHVRPGAASRRRGATGRSCATAASTRTRRSSTATSDDRLQACGASRRCATSRDRPARTRCPAGVGARTTRPGSPGRTTSRTGRASSAPIPWVYAEIVRVLRRARARRDPLPRRGRARRPRASSARARTASRTTAYRLHVVPTDRVWLRDSAPTGVLDASGARRAA